MSEFRVGSRGHDDVITYLISLENRRVVLTHRGFCHAKTFDDLQAAKRKGWPLCLFGCEGERTACMIAYDELLEIGAVEEE